MLAKVARTAAGKPHAGNLGGKKKNICILIHIEEEGVRGLRRVNFFLKLKNFCAKIID